jgi:hypothetical protein
MSQTGNSDVRRRISNEKVLGFGLSGLKEVKKRTAEPKRGLSNQKVENRALASIAEHFRSLPNVAEHC